MKIVKQIVPESKYGIKCPYTMKPTRIVVHNTANDASARNEIAYMTRNDYETSFHYAVDDKEVVQGIEENRNAWHSSDGGKGKGNREGIAIEICYSKSGGDRFIKAEKLAVELIVDILKRYNWGVDKVTKHQDYCKKYCPHRTLDMGWSRFIKMIEDKLNPKVPETKPTPEPKPTTTARKVGDTVTINGVYISSTSTSKLRPLKTKGKITKIVAGARNPYLLENGNIGWVNDACIVSSTTTAPKKKSTDELAREVIQGKWGNGADRKARLEKAGYNYREVQNRVNEMLR